MRSGLCSRGYGYDEVRGGPTCAQGYAVGVMVMMRSGVAPLALHVCWRDAHVSFGPEVDFYTCMFKLGPNPTPAQLHRPGQTPVAGGGGFGRGRDEVGLVHKAKVP